MVMLCAVIVSPPSADGDDAAFSPEGVAFFESKVRPLLLERCNECHSREAGAENGELILETVAGIQAGGTRGSLFGEDDNGGLLLDAVGYLNTDLQMPPEGKLPSEELAILEQWIALGSPLPEYVEPSTTDTPAAGIDFEAGREFWSFRPLAPVEVPSVEHSDWVQRPIDAFILSQLEVNGLSPSERVAPNRLLRRVGFDVIGLPPTLDELDTFVADVTPQAYEQTVERLLASPAYGERWARFWLDLARYADRAPGWLSSTDHGWLYRDWVIRAFNENLPYDEFVKRQLAADLMSELPPTELAALGFLGLSPTYWKELRLAPPVIEQICADEWDERIDVVSRTFLGLTVACARCHDHKFDPVGTRDYYALAGVFASTQLHEQPLLPPEEAQVVRDARDEVERLEAELKVVREQIAAAAAATMESESDANAVEANDLPDPTLIEQQIAELKATPHFDAPWANTVKDASVYVLPDGDELTRLEYRDGESRDLPVFRRGSVTNPSEDVEPRRFLTLFAGDEPKPFEGVSGRLELAEAMLTDSEGLVARVIVNRIWDQHFGSGLVRTSSDFGNQGEQPTHPELLEYLAYEFVLHGWDVKWLQQEILLSATYQQSSAFRDEAAAVDPENRLLWRMPRRRLDIEMWRDAMLSVTGQLDLTLGGSSIDLEDANNHRRTIYGTVVREELNGMLQMHDFPEPTSHSPRREPTTTPLQQLFVLNSPFMHRQAEALWERVSSIEGDGERIRHCYRLLYSRDATDDEVQIGLQFVNGGEDLGADSGNDRWRRYLQSLLSLNEFLFVD